MFVRVEISNAGQAAQKLSVKGPQIILGRDPASQLPFDGQHNSAVSWQHARIDLATSGATLTDLGSSNGTFVNDARVSGSKSIRAGDVIALGQTGPKVRVVEVVTAAAPVHATIAEKMLPHGMLTPPGGNAPLNVSSVSSSSKKPTNKRKRSAIGGIVLGLIGVGAVAAAGFIVFSSRPEKKDDVVAEKPKDEPKPAEPKKETPTPEPKPVEVKAAPLLPDKAPPPPNLDIKTIAPPKEPAPPAPKEPVPVPPPPVTKTGAEIYRLALKSTGWVTVPRSPTSMSTGTGALVDKENRLFLTAYHVVEGAPEARIYFPRIDADGRTIAVRDHYLNNERPVIGEVIVADSKRDLAVLRLQSIPASLQPLPLAKKSIDVAEHVYTVGNPAVSSALWVYTEGSVRQVVLKKLRLDNKQDVEAWMVEAQFPINQGDSGGPVVNDRTELVGVNSSLNAKAQLMSNVIDLREIQAVIERARRAPTLRLGR